MDVSGNLHIAPTSVDILDHHTQTGKGVRSTAAYQDYIKWDTDEADNVIPDSGPFSVFIKIRTNTISAWNTMIGKAKQNTGGWIISLWVGNLYFTKYDSGGGPDYTWSGAYDNNTEQSFGFSLDPSGNITGYRDGVEGWTSTSGNPGSHAGYPFCLFGVEQSASSVINYGAFQTRIVIAYIWDRELSADEHAIINANPYGPITQRRRLEPEAEEPSVGQPTMRRWGGTPGMIYTGRNSW
jgi:hypothetical protein